jgi:glycosyltransferase involved in cell wall biosynthesis
MPLPSICFLGLDNLPALSPAHAHLGVGGEPIQQTLIARALARRGYGVSMVVCDYGQDDGIVIDGITVYKAHRPNAGLPLLRFVHPRWTSVMAALRRADADAYYTSCAGIGTAQLALTARRRGAGTVFRIASDADCDPDRLIIPYWYGKRIYEWGLPRVSRILAQSASQRESMRAHYGLESQVAGMLVDRGRSDLPFAARARHGLWVGNIRQLKRPDLMLEIARRLPQLRFEMVGGTQPRAEPLYAEVVAAAGAMPNLEFAGPVPYAAVGRLFEGSRVFINTSDTEGFPNTYLQAWARGVPVVAFFDPDGVISREGLGHAAGSLEDLQAAVARLSTDEAAWQAASHRCLEFMDREFPEERILRPYIDAFELFAAGREART